VVESTIVAASHHLSIKTNQNIIFSSSHDYYYRLSYRLEVIYRIEAEAATLDSFSEVKDWPSREDLVANWAEEKKRMIESGENPAGGVPILYISGQAHPQHIAAARYLARVKGLTSGDDYKDYVQDLVADEYQGFRDQRAEATFGGDEDAKKDYKDKVVPVQLKKFDSLYESFKTHHTFLSVSSETRPLWGDAAIFGLLRDHILTGYVTREDSAVYP